MTPRRAEKDLQAIVAAHAFFAVIALVLAAVMAAVGLLGEGGDLEPAGWFAGFAAVVLALGLGLHLRRDEVRRLELVFLPLVGVALTTAVLVEKEGVQLGRALLVTGLYWVKAVWAVRALGRPAMRVLCARDDRPPVRALLAEVGRAGLAVLGLAAFAGLAVAFAWLKLRLDPGPTSPLQLVATALGAFLSALLVVLGGAVGLERLRARGREPERLPDEVRERVFALRAEGRTLRAIARALDAERAGPLPWTSSAVKQVLLTRPLRPPEARDGGE